MKFVNAKFIERFKEVEGTYTPTLVGRPCTREEAAALLGVPKTKVVKQVVGGGTWWTSPSGLRVLATTDVLKLLPEKIKEALNEHDSASS